MVAGGLLQVTGLVALFYAVVLFTEGIGVYFQQRWAEMLMVLATATLIPFEVRHVWFHPGAVAIIILAVNCFIVWFLYRVLRRERREEHTARGRGAGRRGNSLGVRLRVEYRNVQCGGGFFQRQADDIAPRADDAGNDRTAVPCAA